MGEGLMCLTCRRYIHAPEHGQLVRMEDACACLPPKPSWDAKTPATVRAPADRATANRQEG